MKALHAKILDIPYFERIIYMKDSTKFIEDNTSQNNLNFKASFSVEAAWIFGISLLVIYLMICFSFNLYKEANDTINSVTAEVSEPVKKFRMMEIFQ